MIPKDIGIIGGGGQADELKSFLNASIYDLKFQAVGHDYVDINNKLEIDIATPTARQEDTPVIAAVGAPLLRKNLISIWSGKRFETVIAKNTSIDSQTSVGEGSIIAPGVIITPGVKIGKHSIINVAATIGHGSILGDFSTVGPGVHLAGNVTIGDGVFIGIGAIIKNNVRVAPGVVIGAGAVILYDIFEENAVYAGVPAKKIGQNSSWLDRVE